MSLPGDTSAESRILIAEDDLDLGDSPESFFRHSGYEVHRATEGAAALQETPPFPHDLVLLDARLPEKDGFGVLREARQSGVDSPVITLTVKDEHRHRLRGFDLGADDYVTTPFDTRERAARVEAVPARSQSALPDTRDVYTFGDVTVHFPDETVTRESESGVCRP